MEKKMILAALEKEDWFQTRAARLLGITERNLRYKMKKYNINNVKRGRKYRSGERNSTGRGGGK
jgi:transcriptional regulator with GAF, ATPase, and Fis domain